MKQKTTLILALVLACWIVPAANAALVGTVPTAPGDTVVPGLVPSGTDPGTLLADTTQTVNGTGGAYTGTLVSAVYMETGGTLDFYYQFTNNAGSKDAVARITDTDFTGFTTATGFRVDGASLTGAGFSNGTVAPVTADRNAPGGDVVGFQFSPPDSAKILPGTTSDVLVISTNATRFQPGRVNVIDGGVTDVAGFEPAVSTTVPEPATFLFLGGGLLALGAIRRKLF